jgi:hypothetical protein
VYDKYIAHNVFGVTFISVLLVLFSYNLEIKLSDNKGNSSGLQPAFILCILATFIIGVVALSWRIVQSNPQNTFFFTCYVVAQHREIPSSMNIPEMTWYKTLVSPSIISAIVIPTLFLWVWLRVRRAQSRLVAGQSVSFASGCSSP